MQKVVANLLCGLIIEDEQGCSLRMTDLDTRRRTKIAIASPGPLGGRSEAVAAMRQVYDELQSPLGMAAERIIQLLDEGEEK